MNDLHHFDVAVEDPGLSWVAWDPVENQRIARGIEQVLGNQGVHAFAEYADRQIVRDEHAAIEISAGLFPDRAVPERTEHLAG